MIIDQIARELGLDFGYEMSASAVFRDIAKNIPAYARMTYPLLKDETSPVQALYTVGSLDSGDAVAALRNRVESLPNDGEKITQTPEVGQELFKIGVLTDKVPQFHLLANGNPRPDTTAISPLYQITSASSVA